MDRSNNKKVVEKGHPSCLEFAHDMLKKSPEFMLPLIEANPTMVLKWAVREIAEPIVRNNPEKMLRHAPDSLRGDKNFVLALLKEGGKIEFRDVWASINSCPNKEMVFSDPAIAMEALKQDPGNNWYLGESLKSDKNFMLDCVKLDGRHIQWASGELKKDEELRQAAVAQAGEGVLKGLTPLALPTISWG